jgi:hypothetical protein
MEPKNYGAMKEAGANRMHPKGSMAFGSSDNLEANLRKGPLIFLGFH